MKLKRYAFFARYFLYISYATPRPLPCRWSRIGRRHTWPQRTFRSNNRCRARVWIRPSAKIVFLTMPRTRAILERARTTTTDSIGVAFGTPETRFFRFDRCLFQRCYWSNIHIILFTVFILSNIVWKTWHPMGIKNRPSKTQRSSSYLVRGSVIIFMSLNRIIVFTVQKLRPFTCVCIKYISVHCLHHIIMWLSTSIPTSGSWKSSIVKSIILIKTKCTCSFFNTCSIN